jgi:hypothetical protein
LTELRGVTLSPSNLSKTYQFQNLNVLEIYSVDVEAFLQEVKRGKNHFLPSLSQLILNECWISSNDLTSSTDAVSQEELCQLWSSFTQLRALEFEGGTALRSFEPIAQLTNLTFLSFDSGTYIALL